MSQFFHIHSDNPQLRLIKQAAQIIHAGGVVAIPTDSCYALICHLDDKNAVTRLRHIRNVDEKHHLTLLCRDLSEIAVYAKINNRQFRMLKAVTPGPYTFILEATKEVPRRLSHPSRKTIGLRIPAHRITQLLLEEVGQPLLSTSLILPDEEYPLIDAEEIRKKLEHQVELVIDSAPCSLQATTVIDLSDEIPILLRQGCGDATSFGF